MTNLASVLSVAVSLPILYLLTHLSSSPDSSTIPTSPFPADLPVLSSRKIVAVGDLHGSLAITKRVLRMAGVMNDADEWILGEGQLVQTGDIVDRGTDTINLYKFFEQLRSDARSAGGEFHSLLGNHEYMNALGDWRYVTQPDIDTFGGLDRRRDALTPEGLLGRTWLANYSLSARVPLHPPKTSLISPEKDLSHSAISFIHAGLPPHLPSSALLPYPSKLNTLAHSFLLKALTANAPPHPPNPFPGLPSTCTREERDLWGGEGVLWYRGWALDEDEDKVCEQAREVMGKVGVRRMVMGHTPNFEGIVSRCNGTILLIDTGISPAYGGPLSAISITTTLHPLPALDLPPSNELRKREMGKSRGGGRERWLERETVLGLSVERDDREEKGERGREEVLAFSERVLGG